MGIDYHALQFLRYAAKRQRFGLTATIGRQGLYLREHALRRVICPPSHYKHEKYCESMLLHCFGATGVESYDNSDYEGASRIADMNEPIECSGQQYDTIIDAGTLEHIYNVPQALMNISELCSEGGQILHILPGNNYCGHGFWQFSPELFFSVYSKENGYSATQVFLADLWGEDNWYEVIKPENGQRAEVCSSTPLFILCRTIKGRRFAHKNVQQSDYVHIWDQSAASGEKSTANEISRLERFKAAMSRSGIAYWLLHLLDVSRMHIRRKGYTSLSDRNPHLIKRGILSLV